MRIGITGGCGFIGVNVARYFLDRGHDVDTLDNLSREGSQKNERWLGHRYGSRITMTRGDFLRYPDVEEWIKHSPRADAIIHLAAQTAVTTSLSRPFLDFAVNVAGTVNLLEAVRAHCPELPVIFASTNKVYGEHAAREPFGNGPLRYSFWPENKVPETRPVLPRTPYGCSKAAADFYVQDYARSFGLRTAVFRQSCIYGQRNLGASADQGWVGHFAAQCHRREGVTIYGDGRQVRDVLWVDDLADAYLRAIERIDSIHAQVFNIGGGPEQTLSPRELVDKLSRLSGFSMPVKYDGWRPGDQRIYVSNIAKAREQLGWEPTVGVDEGIERLWRWLKDGDE